MASLHSWYLHWITKLQGCYARADVNTAWYMKYEVTDALQQLMNTQGPLTRQNMEIMKNLLKLESEISIFIYIIINGQTNNHPLDYSMVRR